MWDLIGSVPDHCLSFYSLKALEFAHCKNLIALMTLMFTNELYPSGFAKNNFIGHRNPP